MISTKGKVEEIMPYTEEKKEEDTEEEDEDTEEEEGEGDDEEDDGNGKGEESHSDKEKEEDANFQARDETEKIKVPLPVQHKTKKQDEALNLNNEVVKMRKEVKRVRALISRKLTRQIAALKKKKGKETEIERNQRRAARLLEEIHAMKVLVPDVVTKTALQKNLNFEQVCKNPKSTIAERATARITTHPQFKKKIDAIKAAVQAFKDERMKGGRTGERRGKVQNQDEKVTLKTPTSESRRGGIEMEEQKEEESEEEEDSTAKQKLITENEEEDDPATVSKTETDPGKSTLPVDTADHENTIRIETKTVRPASIKNIQVKDALKNPPQTKAAESKADLPPEHNTLQIKKDAEESDLEPSDGEEKEYFDDSTEERFHKQSSQSEESASEDDFFVGKVSKFKKKKKKVTEGQEINERHKMKADSADKLKTSDQVQSELDELESRLKSKAPKLRSAFCSSLSRSKPNEGRGAGRGGHKLRGRGNQRGGSFPNRDFEKQSKFQAPNKGTTGNPGVKHSKPQPDDRHAETEKLTFAHAGRRGGRGRGDGSRQRDCRGTGAVSHQALHPSWEASKKRKEQQGQILAFQGKKIKFDDDSV